MSISRTRPTGKSGEDVPQWDGAEAQNSHAQIPLCRTSREVTNGDARLRVRTVSREEDLHDARD